MKKLLLAAVILASSTSYAFEINCEVAVGSIKGRPTTQVEITYEEETAYIFKTVGGYTFDGLCSRGTCDISIKNEDKMKGFVSTNGAFSKQNDNSISISYFANDNTVAEITCQKK